MNSTSRRARPERRGAALVMVIMMVTGLMLLTYTVVFNSTRLERQLDGDYDDQRAFHLAEAGLQEGYACLRAGRSGSVGSMDAPAYLGGGVFWVTAVPVDAERTRLTSTALIGSGRHALETVVHMPPPQAPLFVATLNSKDTLTLNEGVVIDSFQSSLGDYASQAGNLHEGIIPYANDNGDVRSNQDVILNANATVFGDAIPGPTGTVQFSPTSYVSGSIASAPEGFAFPPITIPSYTPLGSYSVPMGGLQTLSPGNYDYDAFTLNRDSTLVVQGPANIVVDDFIGGRTANLVVDATDGPVTFFVRGTYTHERGFESTAATESPLALAFMIEGTQDLVFPSAAMIRGAYYVPDADIVFSSTSECWGSFAGNRISMSNDMRFHFDEDLAEHWSSDTGDEFDAFDILSWNEVGVEPVNLLADRRDPMLVLGLDRRLLASPWDSWQ